MKAIMLILSDHKQISNKEKLQIDEQVKTELVDRDGFVDKSFPDLERIS